MRRRVARTSLITDRLVDMASTDPNSKAQKAVALIRQHGALRSDAIERELGWRQNTCAPTLTHLVENGTLLVCQVTRPGMKAVNEYRISAAAKTLFEHSHQPQGGLLPLRSALLAIESTPGQLSSQEVAVLADLGGSLEVETLPIEKGVPMPERHQRGLIEKTLKAMELGDSIVVKHTSVAAVYDNAKKIAVRVRVEKYSDGSARVWRIA